jgi:hypothetical protein
MTWEEVENFTWEELENLTWQEISRDKYELIAKAENGSISIPEQVQAKLRSLCTELSLKIPDDETKLKAFNLQTVGEFAKNVVYIARLVFSLTGCDSIVDLFKDIYDAIASLCR